MKTKRIVFISCLAAGALIASPAFSQPQKKAAGASSRPHRMAARTTQVTPTLHQSMSSRMSGTRQFTGTQQSTGTRQFVGTGRSGTSYYYGGGYPYYSYYSGWPYSYGGGRSWVGTLGYYPYSYYGGYPYSYYGSYPYSYYGGYPYGNNYSYYARSYGYDAGTVAAVQRRLGQMGYYRSVVDGVMGPQTHGAIAAFESSHGLAVDGTISRPLLNRLGLG